MRGLPPKLPDVLRPGLKLVFCGTAAGAVSAAKRAYYAGPGNRFWSVLAETGLTPRLLEPHQFKELIELGIGLTDVVKHQAGSDSEIRFGSAGAGLEARLRPYAPAYLCFNGKRAAREALGRRSVDYGLQTERFGATRLFVAPSTSAAARRFWHPRHWHELARLVEGLA
jgi:double-stranded uracil-DNA glycosylase